MQVLDPAGTSGWLKGIRGISPMTAVELLGRIHRVPHDLTCWRAWDGWMGLPIVDRGGGSLIDKRRCRHV